MFSPATFKDPEGGLKVATETLSLQTFSRGFPQSSNDSKMERGEEKEWQSGMGIPHRRHPEDRRYPELCHDEAL